MSKPAYKAEARNSRPESRSGINLKVAEPKVATKANGHSDDKIAGVYVLNDRQYQKFYECMTNPREPTEAIKRGAKLHEELSQKRR